MDSAAPYALPASLAGSLPLPRRPGASFRLHLIGILLAALLPACLVGFVVIWQELQASGAEARRGLDEQARTLALTVDAAINARIGLAVALAAMAANGDDPPVFGDQLRDVAARLGAGVFVYGPPPQIRPLANTVQPPGAALLPVLSGTGPADAVPRVFAEVRPQVGRAWFGPLSHTLVAAAFAPVLQGDSVAAAIAVGLDLPGLRDVLRRQAMRPGSTALVVDHAGTVVARSDPRPPLVGEAAPDWAVPGSTGRAAQPDAAGGMVAIVPLVQARGWTVVVRDPATGGGTWHRPAPPLAAAAIFGIAAGAWLALLLARRCLQPVEALTQRAAAISAGLPPDPEPPASEIREFSLLSTSLTAAHAALERQALAARQGQALLESVIEGTPDVLHVKGLDGRTIVANAAADAFFGVPRGGLVGRRSIALSRSSIASVAEAHDAQVLRDGRTVTEEYRVADPVERVFKVTKAPLRQAADGRIAGLIILIQDVTQQRRMEDELRRAEGEMQRLGRRATAGAMASGLAHELNPPLTAATNYLRAADRLLGAGTSPDRLPVLQEAVRAAAEQTLRAGEIIRRLRDFVTRRDSAPMPEPVQVVIEEGVRLGLGALQPPGLRFALTLAEDLAAVRVDRVAVQQVLVNLLRNAIEAMQGCERQALTVSAAMREEEGCRWLDIQVADTGVGLSRDVLDRLFEPFVSTKPDGMGVGLAICRRIAEAQGGSITVAAGAEAGTVFTLTLPIAAATEVAA
jgi:two-component system sensor kinase FixL